MKISVLRWMAVLSAVVAGWSPLVFAYTDSEIRDLVTDVIMQRHPTDTPEWWRSLGTNAPKVIMSMYEGTTQIYHRVRLLNGLGAFQTADVAEFLKEQAKETDEDVIKMTAIRAVGASQGANELEFVSKYLGDKDPQIRFTAADTLKNVKDPKAQSVYQDYLKREKVSWIVNRLKGELPAPSGTLKPVATSEDRLNVEFAGEWRGYWLEPKTATQPGLVSVPVQLRLKVESVKDLKGDLTLKQNGKTIVYSLDRTEGKGSKVSGVLARDVPNPKGKGVRREELFFEGELRQQAGQFLVEIQVPKQAITAVVRKAGR